MTRSRVVLPAPFGTDQAGELPGSDREADLVQDPAARQRDADGVDVKDLRRAGLGSGLVGHHSFCVEVPVVTAFWIACTSASIQDW